MLTYSQIVEYAVESGIKARIKGLKPYNLKNLNFDQIPPFPFPDLGDFLPDGYELVDTWLCDSTGLGYESEPALTVNQLIEKLRELIESRDEYFVGIIESGEFQVVLGIFTLDHKNDVLKNQEYLRSLIEKSNK